MRKLLALTALAAALVAPQAAAAQPTLLSLYTSGSFTPLGNGGYIGSATTLPGLSGPFVIFCTDRNNTISLGSNFIGNIWATPLWNNTDMSKTRLANSAFALDIYRANASLAIQIAPAIDAADVARQEEMWVNADDTPNLAPTFGNAGFDATGWYVFTQVGSAGVNDDNLMQEQLGVGVVPEPSTYALFASGLVGMGMIARRRRNQQA